MIDVVLPTLNEREALPWVLTRMPEGYRPIVVDNGSTDGSTDVARRLGAFVVQEPKRGFGSACKRGLDLATSSIVCFMDSDGSLDPHDLPNVTDSIAKGESDLVLGSRIAEAGAWPWHARVANHLLALELKRRTGVVLSDIGPMRAGRRDGLLELDLRDRRSGWPLEMVIRAIAAGFRLGEAQVGYRKRSGNSKVTGTVGGTLEAMADMGRVLRRTGSAGPQMGGAGSAGPQMGGAGSAGPQMGGAGSAGPQMGGAGPAGPQT